MLQTGRNVHGAHKSRPKEEKETAEQSRRRKLADEVQRQKKGTNTNDFKR